jgi:uncharacterized protein
MSKTVLDTNVLVSGFHFPKSKPGLILWLIGAGELINFVSALILEETARILAIKFLWNPAEAEAVLFWLKTFSHFITPKTRLEVINDWPNNRILECAVTGKVDDLVTGDKHILTLKVFRGIRIMKPATFLEIFS